jgi:hypothetical protein
MFRRRASSDQPNILLDRLGRLEAEMQALRRETAEQLAVHDDLIELALIRAIPNAIYRVIDEVRAQGCRVSYSREPHGDLYGSIRIEHPTDGVHNCSIKLPLSDDPAEHRKIESDIAIRMGLPMPWSQAA